MPNPIAHFAINADDVAATRGFYESVFGWRFSPWGPPDFFLISAGEGVGGALQGRRELLPGERTNAFEVTISVPDVDFVAKAVVANGGHLLMEKTTIAGVGDLVFFADPSGNVAGAMCYDDAVE